jgi:hypothetical protein
MRLAAAIGALLGIIAMPVLAEGLSADAFFGTWVLLADQSHYAREQLPERMTLIMEPAPYGLAYRSETHYVGGKSASSQFVARLDQTPVLVVGNSGFMAPVALGLNADGGIDAVYTSGIKKVAWSHWKLKCDGRELLITTVYLGAQGEEVQNVTAFRRVDGARDGV